ncbi:MAG: hypothetical protein RL189_2951 [Pseudomonadota bacterium]|jgi:uncharacterized membrane protein
MIQILKSNALSWLVILLSLGLALAFSNHFPEQMPVHFSTLGQADRHSSKLFALLFLPVMASVVLVFVSGLLSQSPEGYKAEQSKRTIAQLNFGLTLFMMLIYAASLAESLEPGVWISRAVPVGVTLLTVFMGNYFGKIERNFVVGFRLPWTLASDDNWKQTHRFASRAFVISGLISLTWICIHPNNLVPLVGIILPTLLTIGFSYRSFKTHQQ